MDDAVQLTVVPAVFFITQRKRKLANQITGTKAREGEGGGVGLGGTCTCTKPPHIVKKGSTSYRYHTPNTTPPPLRGGVPRLDKGCLD